MAVRYRDYYEILGIGRDAKPEDIRKAYRKLARANHPDANPNDPKAEERFKEINEAYEVLKDPEKRRRYDALGANWKQGQEFRPPPGYEFRSGGTSGAGFNFGDFSDFFEAIFGGGFPNGGRGGTRVHFGGAPHGFDGFGPEFGTSAPRAAVSEAEVDVPLSTVVAGGQQRITLGIPGVGTRTFNVKIPRGIGNGKKVRLAGEGPDGGDILLKVRYADDGVYRWEDETLVTRARISPARAVLGGKTRVETPGGPLNVTVPAGSSSGRRLRLRGRGMPHSGGAGDLLVELHIDVPQDPGEKERALYQQLLELENGQ